MNNQDKEFFTSYLYAASFMVILVLIIVFLIKKIDCTAASALVASCETNKKFYFDNNEYYCEKVSLQ